MALQFRRDAAQLDGRNLAIMALGFLAKNADHIQRFCQVTGCDPGQIRDVAEGRDFQLAVLDYVLGHEALLRDFAAFASIDPMAVMPAYQRFLAEGDDSF